jgi:hypothetical protein
MPGHVLHPQYQGAVISGPSEAEPLGRQDDTIKKVAYLCAKGEPQKRIAGLLSLSPSMVSRLVDQARKVGLVRETIECQISEPAKLSSSGLATDMHRILNGVAVKGSGRTRAQLTLDLRFVPAFQPDPARFSDDDFRAVLKFASSVSAYGQIFSLREGSLAEDASHEVPPKTGRQTKQSGGVEELKLPLVEHLDAVLTSVGSSEQPGRFWRGEFFRQQTHIARRYTKWEDRWLTY